MTGQQLVVAMLAAVTVLYTGAVIGYSMAGRPGMGVAFAGYVIANAGLIYDALQH